MRRLKARPFKAAAGLKPARDDKENRLYGAPKGAPLQVSCSSLKVHCSCLIPEKLRPCARFGCDDR